MCLLRLTKVVAERLTDSTPNAESGILPLILAILSKLSPASVRAPTGLGK